METKLWQKEYKLDMRVEEFTIGDDNTFDLNIAPYDILASKAHAVMLHSIDVLNEKELHRILSGLDIIYEMLLSERFRIEKGVEDVHSQIEIMLSEIAGEAGKKIHTARSRNDQVLTAIKLYLKAELKEIRESVRALTSIFESVALKNESAGLPGYTHFQIAMPSSFGLWLGAYAEALTEDMEVIDLSINICNKNPLGSAAGYGTNFPVNKKLTAELLEFNSVNENPVYAQMTRGKTEKQVSWSLATIAGTLNKFAYDACLFMCGNFDFISFPDHLTTGSSIMPHKKNPDVFEIIRGKCSVIQGIPNQLTLLCNNLPHGYHRDVQLTKQILFPAIKDIKDCIEMTGKMLGEMTINEKILDDPKYSDIYSVDRVNELVMHGMPFREAYKVVSEMIGAAEKKE